MLSANPQHEVNTKCDNVNIKDVFDIVTQNINPLIKDDLKKILVESTTEAILCKNIVLVSVDEIEKAKKVSLGEEV